MHIECPIRFAWQCLHAGSDPGYIGLAVLFKAHNASIYQVQRGDAAAPNIKAFDALHQRDEGQQALRTKCYAHVVDTATGRAYGPVSGLMLLVAPTTSGHLTSGAAKCLCGQVSVHCDVTRASTQASFKHLCTVYVYRLT